MAKKLNERLWVVAQEYTQQVADLLDRQEWHWIGTNDDGMRPISVCDFDGVEFFTLEDMQVIIDRLDEWVARYGSRDAVAQEVREWQDWWLDDKSMDDHPLVELMDNRLERYTRTYPAINLEQWLMGCPREPRKPTLNDRLRLLACQRDMVRELADKYRYARTLWNVYDNLTAEINEMDRRRKRQRGNL